MSGTPLSRYTTWMTALMIGATAAVAAAVRASAQGWFGAGSETVGVWVADLGSIAVTALAAGVILRVAMRFAKGEPFRRYWLLIGVGAVMYALGDLVWALYELSGKEVPYPGLPDVFYLAEYGFLAVGLVVAAAGYRRLVDWRLSLGLTVAASASVAAAIWVGLLQPYILFDPEVAVAEKAISAVYPAFDVLFAIAPAFFLLLVVSKLGGGRLARPWWAVAAGALLFGVSDSVYAWMQWAGTYQAGSVVDYGWMLAHAAIAVGALMAGDLARG